MTQMSLGNGVRAVQTEWECPECGSQITTNRSSRTVHYDTQLGLTCPTCTAKLMQLTL